jgi:DNA-directed RNA polymerase subunit M/transcription elongation factor TFIIS
MFSKKLSFCVCSVDGFLGPWAPLIEDEEKAAAVARDQEERKKKWAEEQRLKKEEEEKEKRKRSKQMNESSSEDEGDDDTGPSTAELDAAGTTAGEKRRKKNLPDCAEETTVFDYSEERDYQVPFVGVILCLRCSHSHLRRVNQQIGTPVKRTCFL